MKSPAATGAGARRCHPSIGGLAAAWLACGAGAGWLHAGSLAVPNFSFETPVTAYANPPVDSWQKTPKPAWYVENGGFYWEQLVGAFKNPAPGLPDRIDNCAGQQAAWVFAVPEVGLFQDYDSLDWNDAAPTHAFDVTFRTGCSYRLVAGLIGGAGAMLPGVTLELSLYYRDAASNQVPVVTHVVTNSAALFPSTTHLVDVSLSTPPVRAGDPWAGRKLGIRILSTVTHELQGGYWDVDNVRLTETTPPVLSNPVMAGHQVRLTLQSEPGQRCEILASPSATLPSAHWTSLATVTNFLGQTNLFLPATDAQQFYQALGLP